jgi:hypothetical protein
MIECCTRSAKRARLARFVTGSWNAADVLVLE